MSKYYTKIIVQREDVTKHNLDLPSSNEAANKSQRKLKPLKRITDCHIGQWCALLCEGRIYPGSLTNKTDSLEQNPTVEVKAMKNVDINKFTWPLKNDIEEYQLQEIVSLIPEPDGVGRPPFETSRLIHLSERC